MRFFACLIFVGFVVVACGPGAAETCSDFATVWCDKHYSCATGAQLTALQQQYGADATTCARNYAASNCPSDTQTICPTGKSFDSGRQQTCTSEYQNLSCDEVLNNTAIGDCDLFNYICH